MWSAITKSSDNLLPQNLLIVDCSEAPVFRQFVSELGFQYFAAWDCVGWAVPTILWRSIGGLHRISKSLLLMLTEGEDLMGRFVVRARSLVWGLCSLVCILGLGCGKAEKVPELFPVTGKVTYNGKAVPGAQVFFISDAMPAAKKKGKDAADQPMEKPIIGICGDDGTYELFWGENHAGAPKGKYKVAISAVEPLAEGEDTESEVPRPNKVPLKYGKPATSGFTAQVKEDEDNEFNFELKDD